MHQQFTYIDSFRSQQCRLLCQRPSGVEPAFRTPQRTSPMSTVSSLPLRPSSHQNCDRVLLDLLIERVANLDLVGYPTRDAAESILAAFSSGIASRSRSAQTVFVIAILLLHTRQLVHGRQLGPTSRCRRSNASRGARISSSVSSTPFLQASICGCHQCSSQQLVEKQQSTPHYLVRSYQTRQRRLVRPLGARESTRRTV